MLADAILTYSAATLCDLPSTTPRVKSSFLRISVAPVMSSSNFVRSFRLVHLLSKEPIFLSKQQLVGRPKQYKEWNCACVHYYTVSNSRPLLQNDPLTEGSRELGWYRLLTAVRCCFTFCRSLHSVKTKREFSGKTTPFSTQSSYESVLSAVNQPTQYRILNWVIKKVW